MHVNALSFWKGTIARPLLKEVTGTTELISKVKELKILLHGELQGSVSHVAANHQPVCLQSTKAPTISWHSVPWSAVPHCCPVPPSQAYPEPQLQCQRASGHLLVVPSQWPSWHLFLLLCRRPGQLLFLHLHRQPSWLLAVVPSRRPSWHLFLLLHQWPGWYLPVLLCRWSGLHWCRQARCVSAFAVGTQWVPAFATGKVTLLIFDYSFWLVYPTLPPLSLHTVCGFFIKE